MIAAARDLGSARPVHMCSRRKRPSGWRKPGADILIPHMGLTTKGAIGAKTAISLEQAAAKAPLVQELADTAKGGKPRHPGPLSRRPDFGTRGRAVHPRPHEGHRRLLRCVEHRAPADRSRDHRLREAIQGSEAVVRLPVAGKQSDCVFQDCPRLPKIATWQSWTNAWKSWPFHTKSAQDCHFPTPHCGIAHDRGRRVPGRHRGRPRRPDAATRLRGLARGQVIHARVRANPYATIGHGRHGAGVPRTRRDVDFLGGRPDAVLRLAAFLGCRRAPFRGAARLTAMCRVFGVDDAESYLLNDEEPQGAVERFGSAQAGPLALIAGNLRHAVSREARTVCEPV